MKLMILLSRFPYPLEKGDKLRAYYQIKYLAQYHEIVLCCLTDKKIDPNDLDQLKPFCSDILIIKLNKFELIYRLVLGIFQKKPWQVNYFYQKHAQKKIDLFIEKHLPKHIYCQLIRVTEYVKKYTIIPKSLDYMDALSAGAEKRQEKSSFLLKFLFKEEAKRLKKYEQTIYPYFQYHTIISSQDKEKLQLPIQIIPNGVDTEKFKPIDLTKKYDIVFTGNMSYPPNVDSAIYLAKEILPLLLKDFPAINILISGANPVQKVKNLTNKYITVSGWVEDISLSYAESKIFVAPMRIGSGLQNKLLEAMAMKIPCVTTPLAHKALGDVSDAVICAKNNEEFVIQIYKLLTDEKYYEYTAQKGYNFVKNQFNWDSHCEKLNKMITY
jgi:polysaccharide biosynthesis protein PslH